MLDTGTIVAGYRVDGLLGEGGMGAVYRATQLSLNRVIALKVLSSEFSDDPGFRARFRREGLLQATLDHAHIVTVYEAGETDQGLFLAMRLVQGPTLKDMILSKELDTDRGLAILGSVADALDTAHEVGLIHRDVKPQNILVGARDHAYLADFGLTKGTGEGGLTETGQFVGTIDYVAPEQVQGEQATACSDVYSLTGVLYETLAGEVPFSRSSEAAVLYAHISDPPPALSERRPDLPEAIDEVIAKGMAKQPEERYATPTELMREAAGVLGKGAGPISGLAPPGTSGEGQTAAASTRLTGTPTAPAGVPPAAGAGATAPARVPPAASKRRGPPFAVVGVAVAAVLATAGFVAGSSGGDEEGVEFTSSASAGNLGISFPVGWERLSQQPGIPGIDMSDPIVLQPQSAKGGRLAAGLVDATGPALLPASFRKLLPKAVPPGEAVRLGKVEAYRYLGLRPRGLDGRVDLYTAPTSGGVATIVCTAGASGQPLDECEAVATTLELSGVRAYPVGPSEAYAKSLGAALDTLGSARRSGEAALRRASTQDAQAAAAGRLASAYAAAAGALDRAQVSPADGEANGQALAALRGIAGAYRRAASAARAGDGAAFVTASREVRSGGRRLQRALASLEDLGYAPS